MLSIHLPKVTMVGNALYSSTFCSAINLLRHCISKLFHQSWWNTYPEKLLVSMFGYLLRGVNVNNVKKILLETFSSQKMAIKETHFNKEKEKLCDQRWAQIGEYGLGGHSGKYRANVSNYEEIL